MGRSPALLLIVVAVLIAVSLVATYRQRPPRSEQATKWSALGGIFAEVPIYPDFQATAPNAFSKDLLASLGKSYNSRARYPEVRAFYIEKLGAMGWQLTQETNHKYWWRRPAEHQLTFHKGNYSVVIKYREHRTNDSDWNYAIELYEPVLGFDVAA
jgi:hypothetical protein